MKAAWWALGLAGYLALPLAFFLACLEPSTPALRGLSDAGAPSSAAGSAGSGGAAGAAGAGGAGGSGGALPPCERARLAGPVVGLPRLPWHCALESTYVPGGCASCFVMVPPVPVTLHDMARLTPYVGSCHAEMVRSPLPAEQAAGTRRAALVVDVAVTSGGVGAAPTH